MVLPEPLQACHQYDGWRLRVERDLHCLATETGRQFLQDDFDDLLTWVEGLGEFIPNSTVADTSNQALHNLEVHIGFEKGEPDLTERLVDVFLAQLPFAAELVEDACLLYTSPSPRDRTRSRMPSSA